MHLTFKEKRKVIGSYNLNKGEGWLAFGCGWSEGSNDTVWNSPFVPFFSGCTSFWSTHLGEIWTHVLSPTLATLWEESSWFLRFQTEVLGTDS